jgi:hypothetical protein
LYGYVGGNPVNLVDPEGLQIAVPLPPIVPVIPGYGPGPIDTNGNGKDDAGEVAGQLDRWLCGHSIIWRSINACSIPVAPPVPSERPMKGAIPDCLPTDLCEQLALAAAKAGAGRYKMGPMGDAPRLIAFYGPGPWRKKEYVHTCPNGKRLTIHYFSNGRMNVELKFTYKGW